MKQWICETCGEPCDVVEGYEEIPDEFGMQRHYLDISECCNAEAHEEEVPDKEDNDDAA